MDAASSTESPMSTTNDKRFTLRTVDGCATVDCGTYATVEAAREAAAAMRAQCSAADWDATTFRIEDEDGDEVETFDAVELCD